jgi:hypothetical protein
MRYSASFFNFQCLLISLSSSSSCLVLLPSLSVPSVFWCEQLWIRVRVKFYILVTVHYGVILINKQLDPQFLLYVFISILYMFWRTLCSSSGESIVTVRYAGREGTSRPAYRTVTDTEWHIPDVVLIQLTLLMMSTRLVETCRESK